MSDERSCENCVNNTPKGVCKLGETECWKCAYGIVDHFQPRPDGENR